MAYTAPTTRATDDLITAAIFNTDLVNNISFLANPPSCNVHASVGAAPANDTETTLTFDVEDHDTDNMHSTSVNTGRLTFNTPGVYVVTANLSWPTNGVGYRYAAIRLNGSVYVVEDSKTASSVAINVGHSLAWNGKIVTAGDYLEVRVRQTAGVLSVATTPAAKFAATWIGLG